MMARLRSRRQMSIVSLANTKPIATKNPLRQSADGVFVHQTAHVLGNVF